MELESMYDGGYYPVFSFCMSFVYSFLCGFQPFIDTSWAYYFIMGIFLCQLLLLNMCPTTLASIVSRGGGHSNNAGTKQSSSSSNNEARYSAAVTLALPDIKMIKFDPDYDLHVRPNPQADGQPIDVYFSVNLRNVLQVKRIWYRSNHRTSISYFLYLWEQHISSSELH